MITGDTPIHIDEPLFVLSEASEITRVPVKSINNWTQREVISIGTMQRTGRRLYSILDLCQLRVMGDLSSVVNVIPGHAAAIAEYVRKRGFERTERDEDGKLRWTGTKHGTRNFFLVWNEGDTPKIKHEVGTEWLKNFFWPHPVVVIPVDDVISSVTKAAMAALERDSEGSE
ncbi:MerR family transcriptional regulator [Aestuariivirga sp.]|uniref:MerR family transcriptional regulator n=1 Tax=Aestuariivirga sp. TaxID=2650926 RepID=UPI0035AEF0F1